jgi:hypothetical protein
MCCCTVSIHVSLSFYFASLHFEHNNTALNEIFSLESAPFTLTARINSSHAMTSHLTSDEQWRLQYVQQAGWSSAPVVAASTMLDQFLDKREKQFASDLTLGPSPASRSIVDWLATRQFSWEPKRSALRSARWRWMLIKSWVLRQDFVSNFVHRTDESAQSVSRLYKTIRRNDAKEPMPAAVPIPRATWDEAFEDLVQYRSKLETYLRTEWVEPVRPEVARFQELQKRATDLGIHRVSEYAEDELEALVEKATSDQRRAAIEEVLEQDEARREAKHALAPSEKIKRAQEYGRRVKDGQYFIENHSHSPSSFEVARLAQKQQLEKPKRFAEIAPAKALTSAKNPLPHVSVSPTLYRPDTRSSLSSSGLNRLSSATPMRLGGQPDHPVLSSPPRVHPSDEHDIWRPGSSLGLTNTPARNRLAATECTPMSELLDPRRRRPASSLGSIKAMPLGSSAPIMADFSFLNLSQFGEIMITEPRNLEPEKDKPQTASPKASATPAPESGPAAEVPVDGPTTINTAILDQLLKFNDLKQIQAKGRAYIFKEDISQAELVNHRQALFVDGKKSSKKALFLRSSGIMAPSFLLPDLARRFEDPEFHAYLEQLGRGDAWKEVNFAFLASASSRAVPPRLRCDGIKLNNNNLESSHRVQKTWGKFETYDCFRDAPLLMALRFVDVNAIRFVDISENRLTEPPKALLDALPHLTHLYLHGNSLTQLSLIEQLVVKVETAVLETEEGTKPDTKPDITRVRKVENARRLYYRDTSERRQKGNTIRRSSVVTNWPTRLAHAVTKDVSDSLPCRWRLSHLTLYGNAFADMADHLEYKRRVLRTFPFLEFLDTAAIVARDFEGVFTDEERSSLAQWRRAHQ